ncbi:hypothetical protein BMS3Bbin03_02840 [bacterium BMS3Bbin03]|nr:hypothetical protein BMS3Bbin03_02840 [bacterium BMS3Bbin03]HDL78599.1 GWxTD domain-containing protein [Bacteroidota bacterium]
MLKRLRIQLGMSVFLLFAFSNAQAELARAKDPGLINYYYQIANFPSPDLTQSNCKVFIEVPYDELVFVRVDSGFQAEYSFSVYLFDRKNKEMLFEKNWVRKVFTKHYKETNQKKRFDRFDTEINTPPGRYKLRFEVKDKQTNRPFYFKIPVKIKDFRKAPVSFGSILLLTVPPDSPDQNELPVPIVSNRFSKNFFAFFTVGKTDPKDFNLLFQIKNRENGKIFQRDTLLISGEKRFFKFSPMVRVDSLISGKYVAEVSVLHAKNVKPERTPFEVAKAMEFKNAKQLDQAVEVLVYIASSDQLEAMKQAKSFAEKKKLFDAFWERVDPAPGTELNELQTEYYRRVRYANEHFGVAGHDGWKTDRGKTYILYGPPDSVERQFDERTREYEIWRYNKLGRSFVFFDQFGDGNYRLVERR